MNKSHLGSGERRELMQQVALRKKKKNTKKEKGEIHEASQSEQLYEEGTFA